MLIGIAGGIGSGKSVVCRILRVKGYDVLDCDLEARRLMDNSLEIKEEIRDRISPGASDGTNPINRKILSGIVFSDEKARLTLNEIVHGRLKDYISRKVSEESGRCLFIEAAILAESGLARECDRIWKIDTPCEERIKRICERDNCELSFAKAKLKSQEKEQQLLSEFLNKTDVIFNSDHDSLILQINKLLLKI